MSAVRYLFDENCSARIVRGVRRRAPSLSTLTVQEAGLRTGTDADLLVYAAVDGRLLVSHDFRTLKASADLHLQAQKPMAGLILIPQGYPVGQAIEALVLIAEVSTAEEWQNTVVFLPL